MKKIFVFFCVTILLCTLVSPVHAVSIPNAPTEYSVDGAMDIIFNFNWDGKVHKQEKIGMKTWLHSFFAEQELSPEDEDAGYRYIYTSEDNSILLTVTSTNIGMSPDEFVSELKAHNFKDVTELSLNGADCVLYYDPTVTECICRVASFVQGDGSVIEFVFYYADNEYLALLAETCLASIRPLD